MTAAVFSLSDWKQTSVFLLAVAITIFLYGSFNAYMLASLGSQYRRFQIPALKRAATQEEAERAVVFELQWLSKKQTNERWFQDWFQTVWDRPAQEQFFSLLELEVLSQRQAEREALFQRVATGNMQWWIFPPALLATQSPTGQSLWDAQLQMDDGLLRANLSDRAPDREAFESVGIGIASELADTMHARLRTLKRVNGWIQWIVIVTAVFLFLLMLQRWCQLRRLNRSFPGVGFPDDPELNRILIRMRALDVSADPTAREQFVAEREHLRQRLEHGLYGELATGVSLLPSLGFIGTVWGIGEGLLRADELMTASDRQTAIRNVTEQLGYAFDTTFVALLATVVLVFFTFWLRWYEQSQYDRLVSSPFHHD